MGAPSGPSGSDDLELLDGGAEAFPRMLEAIAAAQRTIHLEVYTLALDTIGEQFVTALRAAAARGVAVKVILDAWGSVEDADELTSELREAGIDVTLYNPVSRLFFGRLWRDHRKILLVDDAVAFLGGINIALPYFTTSERPGWADIAVRIRGSAAFELGQKLRGEPVEPSTNAPVRIRLSGIGGGGRLRKRYLKSIARARTRILLAHAYFLPDRRLVKSLRRAARRGVEVQLLLAGRSDVLLARPATMRLYRSLLLAGVKISEWEASVLHAKAMAIDGHHLLVGSFNLDPLSMTNLEALVEVEDPRMGAAGEAWITTRVAKARTVTLESCRRSPLQALLLDRLGYWVARLSFWLARAIAPHRSLEKARRAAVERARQRKLLM